MYKALDIYDKFTSIISMKIIILLSIAWVFFSNIIEKKYQGWNLQKKIKSQLFKWRNISLIV